MRQRGVIAINKNDNNKKPSDSERSYSIEHLSAIAPITPELTFFIQLA